MKNGWVGLDWVEWGTLVKRHDFVLQFSFLLLCVFFATSNLFIMFLGCPVIARDYTSPCLGFWSRTVFSIPAARTKPTTIRRDIYHISAK